MTKALIVIDMFVKDIGGRHDEKELVANQKSNNIVSFKRDSLIGLLEYTAQIEAPIPVFLLF